MELTILFFLFFSLLKGAMSILYYNINYKVISIMFSDKIVDFKEKLCDNGVVDITTAQFP